jgi:hypothetical protein
MSRDSGSKINMSRDLGLLDFMNGYIIINIIPIIPDHVYSIAHISLLMLILDPKSLLMLILDPEFLLMLILDPKFPCSC